jgi:predicted nucleic acid-binding protein
LRTAVDTSVLLDVLGADPEFGEGSRAALKDAYDSGALLASEIVWSEVRAHFSDDETFGGAMRSLGVAFDPLTAEAARKAGALWRAYCLRVRKARARVVADFMVGAHALHQADVLLCRDRGFLGSEFEDLQLVDPSSDRK